MTIKIRVKEGKATVRFNNNMDEKYFIDIIRFHRDHDKVPHEIKLRGRDGKEIPELPSQKIEVKPKPEIVKNPNVKKDDKEKNTSDKKREAPVEGGKKELHTVDMVKA